MVDDNKKSELFNLLTYVRNISDTEYQRRVWIEGKGPEVKDFDETVNEFFDVDWILKKYKEYGLTDNQYEILLRFRNHFELFADEHDFPEEFIDTPEWKKIMDEAKEVLAAFNYPEQDPGNCGKNGTIC